MKISLPVIRRPLRPTARGFTLTELALCIAVVSVALVAIIGVLPTGLSVQRHNREETIVTEDGKVLVNALRTGAVGSENLLKNVDFILWARYRVLENGLISTTPQFLRSYRSPSWDPSPTLKNLGYTDPIVLTNAAQIVGLMTAPRFVSVNGIEYKNIVRAQIRAIGGTLSEKPIQPLAGVNSPGPDGLTLDQRTEFSFRYLVTPEVTSVAISPVGGSVSQSLATAQQVHELALTFQWPVILRSGTTSEAIRVGHNSRVYRTQIFGQLMDLNPRDASHLNASGAGLKHFSPSSL